MRKYLILFLLITSQALAVEPDEILSDPALEARAREVSKELRCLVCRNESIDESNAELARDLRLLVRERIVAGDTNEETIEYVVERYGEYVLLKPTFGMHNLLLWLSGPILLVLGGIVAIVFVRHRPVKTPKPQELSAEEQARLDALLKD